ncbi:hypothetical protein Glove_123g32 [Diversispora epigaea]|uniref:Uncharacterized protein n=1 Tax=Diversispora epigaea TaxID=1348612 RepID=A0A397J830_9GLOM|nr:hypothetical protein Glove_123g32 [Diversispora epigaea]
MIAINFNILSNYHWDKLDAPNCLCCLIPLGDFQEDDNFNFMKIDDAELESKLHNNQSLNSKTPTFTKPRKFQTMEYTNDNNDINQRQRNLNN